jgi:hypothetical protein
MELNQPRDLRSGSPAWLDAGPEFAADSVPDRADLAIGGAAPWCREDATIWQAADPCLSARTDAGGADHRRRRGRGFQRRAAIGCSARKAGRTRAGSPR